MSLKHIICTIFCFDVVKLLCCVKLFKKFLTCFNKHDGKKISTIWHLFAVKYVRGWQDNIPVLLSSAKLPSQCKSLHYSQHVCAQGALQAGDCSPLQSRATSPQWLNKVNENNKAQHDPPPMLIYPVFTGQVKGGTGQMENLTSSVPQRRSHLTSDFSLLILV